MWTKGHVSFRGLGHSDDVLPPLCPDLEKRKNPVCHFVTPLDGSVEVDEHRRPEVNGSEHGWPGKELALTQEETTHEGWEPGLGSPWGDHRAACWGCAVLSAIVTLRSHGDVESRWLPFSEWADPGTEGLSSWALPSTFL